MKEYDALVFIGRFQPFHIGHQKVVEEALNKAHRVIICIGSAFEPRSIRNPFTFEERKEMIVSVYGHENISIVPVPDYPYNEPKWISAVYKGVRGSVLSHDYNNMKIGLIGHSKDHTSYYLKTFPKWGSVEVENFQNIDATDIRKGMFSSQAYPYEMSVLSGGVLSFLHEFRKSQDFKTLKLDYELINEYKRSWETAPYPPIFQTTDAVVIQSGHILLIKRKSSPGIGQWALPGGFLNQTETLKDGMIRELKEETKIKVPIPVLRGSIQDFRTFDAPNRSSRGRTITTAFLIDLGYSMKLEKITAADDAEKVKWIRFDEIRRDMLFEDHFHIIDYFLNLEV